MHLSVFIQYVCITPIILIHCIYIMLIQYTPIILESGKERSVVFSLSYHQPPPPTTHPTLTIPVSTSSISPSSNSATAVEGKIKISRLLPGIGQSNRCHKPTLWCSSRSARLRSLLSQSRVTSTSSRSLSHISSAVAACRKSFSSSRHFRRRLEVFWINHHKMTWSVLNIMTTKWLEVFWISHHKMTWGVLNQSLTWGVLNQSPQNDLRCSESVTTKWLQVFWVSHHKTNSDVLNQLPQNDLRCSVSITTKWLLVFWISHYKMTWADFRQSESIITNPVCDKQHTKVTFGPSITEQLQTNVLYVQTMFIEIDYTQWNYSFYSTPNILVN